MPTFFGRESVEERGEVVDIDAIGQVDISRHAELLEVGQRLDGVVDGVGGEDEEGGVALGLRREGDGEGARHLLAVGTAGDVEQVAGGDALAVGEHGQHSLLAVAVVDATGTDLVGGRVPTLGHGQAHGGEGAGVGGN